MASSDDPSDSNPKSPAAGITRRQFLPMLGAAAVVATMPRTLQAHNDDDKHSSARAQYVYVGTYTAPDVPPGGTHPSTAVGIYVFRSDPHDGDLDLVQVVTSSNPSFLAFNPSKTRLYSVNEDLAGRVSSYTINPNGTLSFINTASANGQYTTHINVHPSGQYLYAANYGTGNYPVFRLLADGSIGPMTANLQGVGNGTGPNAGRQEGAHAHQILTDLDGNHIFGVDLGADKINVVNIDLPSGTLTSNTVPYASVASGSGPRHIAFHPNKKRVYVLNELVSSVDVFNYDPARGALIWAQTISTLPRSFTGANTTAEIRIHPSGKFLYNTNRGHNSITMYEIDSTSGRLRVIGWESTRGEWPRGMNIDPSGTFLYAANQNTDSIAVFRIRSNGELHQSALVRTPTPVDVEFGRTI